MAVKKTEAVQEDPMDIIEPVYEPLVVELSEEYTFEVKPLSFFGKMEFFSVMGKAIEEILEEGAVNVTDLVDTTSDLPLSSAIGEADQFVVTISKLVQHAPELLLDLYLIILGVPKRQRSDVKVILEDTLDDETGFKILDVFIEQNAELMIDFFHKEDSRVGEEDFDEGPKIGPIEALESYSADHAETVEELGNWYWKKFEYFYAAHTKRKSIQEAVQAKNAMVSGLWSNSNWDDDKNSREKAIEQIEESHRAAIKRIYSDEEEYKRNTSINYEDPFFAAIAHLEE